MDTIPQKELGGTKALCALFEAKANNVPQQKLHSISLLDLRSAGASKIKRDCPLLDTRTYNSPLKNITTQVSTIIIIIIVIITILHSILQVTKRIT